MRTIRKLATLGLLALLCPLAQAQQSSPSGVNALLFFQPFCDQCFAVIDNFLVPLTQEQGEGLRLEPVDLSVPEGMALYEHALESFGLPLDDGARPALVVGDEILRGEGEILAKFPELLERGRAVGGIALPELPGLGAFLRGGKETPPEPEDDFAMGLAWGVFVILILSLAYAGRRALGGAGCSPAGSRTIVTVWVPLLALIGLAISAYLSYVELGSGEAACGPVGNCSRVQSSPYSKIVGIPMAYLGTFYYAALICLWAVQRFVAGGTSGLLAWLLLPATIFGALFSLYLTSLELFVIHAVCIWCLGSALVTALLTVVVARALLGQVRRPAARTLVS